RGTPRGGVLVHMDRQGMLFVKDIPEHASIIADYRIDPGKPYVPRSPEPEEGVTGWRAAVGCAASPWYSEGMARAFLLLGSAGSAATYLVGALKVAPDDLRLRLALAQTSFAMRRFDVARAAYRAVLGEPGQARGDGLGGAEDWKNLGLCCEAMGDAAAAVEAYEACVRLEPG